MTINEARALSFHDCCKAISDDYDKKWRLGGKAAAGLSYATSYAQAGLTMAEGSREARVQALYILNNITHWRHPDAAVIRARLRQLGELK